MKSYWNDTVSLEEYKELKKDISTNVCIVGGGIVGILCAYKLSKLGYKVTILERDKVFGGVSGNTTAKITSQHNIAYKEISNKFGIEKAKQYLEANENAIKALKEIIKKENIECELEEEDAYLYTTKEEEIQVLKEELEVLEILKFDAEFVTTSELPFDILGAIKFKNQAQFHPKKFIKGILDSLDKEKVEIYENTKVMDIETKGEECIVTTEKNTITASHVIMATHYPILNNPGYHFLKMYQEMSYAIAIDTKQELFSGMYINPSSPTFSFRTIKDNDKRLLIIGGSDHKTGTKQDITKSYEDLIQKAKSLYPNMEVKYKWATQDCMTLDRIPYIGVFSDLMSNVYLATGFNKWGMTSSYIASDIIKDLITENENEYADVFSSTRFHPIKNIKELGDIGKEVGKSLVGELGKKKPRCSHLGCELEWNKLEETWDCPCHGSRFTKEGKSIYSPSLKDIDLEGIEYDRE